MSYKSLLAQTISPSLIAQNLKNGLVAYYPFNGNANDESGNGNNGNVFGAILTNDRFGKNNSAYSFDESKTDYIIGDASKFPSGNSPRSISFWIRTRNLGSGLSHQILGYGGESCGQSFNMNLENSDIGPNYIGKYEVQGHCRAFQTFTSFPTPNTNVWHHIVVTYDGSIIRFYNNGVLVFTSNPVSINTVVLGKVFVFGREANQLGTGAYFEPVVPGLTGELDEIWIHNRALTAQEVNQLFTNATCSGSLTYDVFPDVLNIVGKNTVLDAGAGYASYVWSTGATQQTITTNTRGFYKVTVTDQSGCSASDSTFLNLFFADIKQNDTTICKGSSITLSIDSTGLAGSTECASTQLPTNLQNGLVAYYPFCGNANDASGNGNNGIIYGGATLVADRFGNPSSAYNFNGTSQYIQSATLSKSITNKTYSAWVKLSTLNQRAGGLVGIQSASGQIFDVTVYNETNNGWGFGSDNLTRSYWSGVKEIASEWAMITATYEQNNYKIYRNGILIGTTTQFGITNFNTSSKINIGYRHTGGGSPYLNGIIDDVYVFDRVLTLDEISLLYKSTSISWSTGASSNSITVSPTQTTKYFVTVSDGINTSKDSVTVNVADVTGFNPLSDTLRECNSSKVLDAGSGLSNIIWSTGANSQTISPSISGQYKLSATDANGCLVSDSTYLSLINAKILQNDTTLCQNSPIPLEALAINSSSDTWLKISTQTDSYTRVLKLSNGRYLAAAQINNRLYSSTDLDSFVPFSSNFSDHNLSFGIDKFGILYYGSSHQGIYRSSDNGLSWQYSVAQGFGCGNLDFQADDDNVLYTSVGGFLRGLYVSKNNGASWVNTFSGRDFTDIESLSGFNKVFITTSGNIWSTSNKGTTWDQITGQPFSTNTILIKSFKSNVYVCNSIGEIFVSNDGGTSWTYLSKINLQTTPSIYLNDFVFVNDQTWFASIDKNGVFQSDDGGLTWRSITNGLSGDSRYLFYDNNTLLATTSDGIYKLAVNQPKYSYKWSTGDTTKTINVSPKITTKYFLTVTSDNFSCSDSVLITVNDLSNFNPLPDTISQCGKDLILDAGDNFQTYNWSNGTASKSITVSESGRYTVNVKTAEGCTASDTTLVSLVYVNIDNSDTIVCAPVSLKLQITDTLVSKKGGWELLIPASSFNFSETNFREGGFDPENAKLYSVLKNGSINRFYVFDLNTNSVQTLESTSPPGEIYDYTYDFTNSRIIGTRVGRDRMFSIPLTGGTWSPFGNGSFDAESYGCATYWNPVSRRPGFFGGYGFFSVKNWVWENNGNAGWQNVFANTSNCIPPKRTGQIARNKVGDKLFIFSGQGSCDGNQFANSCSLSQPWATDVGIFCWLKDLWELDLNTYTFKNILPPNSPSIVNEGGFAYDYNGDVFYNVGGYKPLPTFSPGATSNLNYDVEVYRYRRGVDNGFELLPVDGTKPPVLKLSAYSGRTYFDAKNNRVIWARNDGIWALNLGSSGSVSYKYKWSTGDSTTSITVNPTKTTTYYVSVTDGITTCSDSIKVTVEDPTKGIRYPTQDIIINRPTELTARKFGTTYLWNPDVQLSSPRLLNPIITPTKQQQYTVKITTDGGCVTVDTLLVRVFPDRNIYVPEGFSPDADGRNDRLYPIPVGIREIRTFRIYNRWGTLIYDNRNANVSTGWDGTYLGTAQPMESYVWIAEGIDIDGKFIRRTGNTILVR
jgi:gliding motility-associated-like protein